MILKLRSDTSLRPKQKEKFLIHFTQQNCTLKPSNLYKISCCYI